MLVQVAVHNRSSGAATIHYCYRLDNAAPQLKRAQGMLWGLVLHGKRPATSGGKSHTHLPRPAPGNGSHPVAVEYSSSRRSIASSNEEEQHRQEQQSLQAHVVSTAARVGLDHTRSCSLTHLNTPREGSMRRQRESKVAVFVASCIVRAYTHHHADGRRRTLVV